MAPLRNFGLVLLLASFGWAKEATSKKSKEGSKDCPACEDCSALQEKIKSLEVELAKAKELSGKAKGDSTAGLPYASFQILEKSFSTVSELVNEGLGSTQIPMPDLSIGELSSTAWNKANKSYAQAKELITQAAPVVSSTAALAQQKAGEASAVASDIYATHLKDHVGEYVTVSVDVYGKHLSPHVTTAQKMYYESVYPHITEGSKVLSGSLSSILEQGMELSKDISVADGLGTAFTKVKASSQSLDFALSKISFVFETKTLKFLGRTFSFPYGYIDIASAALQIFCVAFLVLYLTWKLFLKTLVWNILLKVIGRKILYGTVTTTLKLCYKITWLLQKILWSLISLALRAIFFAVKLLITCSMGLGLVTGADKAAQAGLQKSAKDFGVTLEMRLAASLAIGMLFYCCCCCGKRKKLDKVEKSKKGAQAQANGHTNGHAKSSAPKAQPKKGGKK